MRRLGPLFLLFVLGVLPAAAERLHYRAVSGVLPDGRVALRAWDEATGPRLLVADPRTLATAVVEGTEGSLAASSPTDTPWDRWRAEALGRRNPLQNAGVTGTVVSQPGAWLTFDLCPSKKPLDRALFTDLEQDQRPLPVFLEVSGRWMETHPDDLAWLTAERDEGRLAVTWVNHSENHRYVRKVPLKDNFLLLPGTDLTQELFAVEQRLLDRGEVPSVFFRFPGLVSSPALVEQVVALGLIPLGSSAWLAKKQAVGPGALVLVHPNGNEPVGEVDLEQWEGGHRKAVRAGLWRWLGLEDWVGATARP